MPEETEPDAEETQDDDQTRAAAHDLIDNAEGYIVITVEKDMTIKRIRSASESYSVALLGALYYQIQRLVRQLDEWKQEDEEDIDDTEAEESTKGE